MYHNRRKRINNFNKKNSYCFQNYIIIEAGRNYLPWIKSNQLPSKQFQKISNRALNKKID